MWKIIPKTKGFYYVSNAGQIKSVERLVYYKHGGKPRHWPEKIMKPYLGTNGYLQVDLKVEGTRRKIMVHRIVAEAFILNPNNYKYVNHKDSNKLNNLPENLEWCTNSVNVRHCIDSGHHSGVGSTHYKAKKITDGTNRFGTLQEAGDFYGISKKVVYDMISGRSSNRLNLSYL